MFHTIPTTTTRCRVEVSLWEGRWIVQGEEVPSFASVAKRLKAAGCPCPQDCADQTAFLLEEQAATSVPMEV